MTEDAHCLAIKTKCISIDFRMLRVSLYPNSTARAASGTSTSFAIRNAIQQQSKGLEDFQPELDMHVWTPYVLS